MSDGYSIRQGMQTVKVSLISAQILNLGSTPIVLLSAPPSGMAYNIFTIIGRLNFVTLAYATNLTLQFYNAGATPNYQFNNAALLASTITRTQKMVAVAGSGTNTTQILTATDFRVNVATGNPTTGDGNIDFWITYQLINLN